MPELVRTWLQRDIGWQPWANGAGNLTDTIGGVDDTDLTRVGVRFANDTASDIPVGNGQETAGVLSFENVHWREFLGSLTVSSANLVSLIKWWDTTTGLTDSIQTSSPQGATPFDIVFATAGSALGISPNKLSLSATITGTPNTGAQVIYENMRLLGTSLTEDVPGGMYGGKLLADIVAQVTGITPGRIDTGSDFAVPSCDASTRRYVIDIVNEICSYYTREWAVWEGGRFDWKQPNLDEVQWICHVADLQPGTEITRSIDDCYSRIFVEYTNAGAADNGFPGRAIGGLVRPA